MPNQQPRLAKFLGHDAIRQAAKPARTQSVETDDAFNDLLKRLADVEPAKYPRDNDN